MVGHVQNVEQLREVGRTSKKFKVKKFVLSNDDGKLVQCIAWKEMAETCDKSVTLSKVFFYHFYLMLFTVLFNDVAD